MPLHLRSALLALSAALLCVTALPASHFAKPASDLVDINRATLSELEQIPGITPVWAARIIRFRPYRTKRDLLDRGVLSADIYRLIRDGVVAHRVSDPVSR
jgi:competence protein ComEA